MMTDCSSSRLRRSSSSSICGDDGNKWPGYIASISGSRLGKRRSFDPNNGPHAVRSRFCIAYAAESGEQRARIIGEWLQTEARFLA
jgi:hypothetical protein